MLGEYQALRCVRSPISNVCSVDMPRSLVSYTMSVTGLWAPACNNLGFHIPMGLIGFFILDVFGHQVFK